MSITCMTGRTILDDRYWLIFETLVTRLSEEDLVSTRVICSINLILKLRCRRKLAMIHLMLMMIDWLTLIYLRSRRLLGR